MGSYLDVSDWLNPAKLSLYYQTNSTSPWVRDYCGQRTTAPCEQLCDQETGSSFVVSMGSYLDVSDWLNPAKLSLYYQTNSTSPWVRDYCGQRTTAPCEQLCDQETGVVETPSHLHRRAGRRTHFHGASAVESPGPILVATPFRESTALYQGGREEPARSVEDQQRRLEAEGAAVCEECGNFEHVYGEFPWTDPLFKEAYFGQERSHVRNGSNSPKADSPSTPTSLRSRPEVGASPAGSQGTSPTAPSKRRRNSPEGKGGHSRR
ncbi:UNVERIFIED_CONTAM: hypothetical protein FKN15_023931 [Acipenser sinensis]